MVFSTVTVILLLLTPSMLMNLGDWCNTPVDILCLMVKMDTSFPSHVEMSRGSDLMVLRKKVQREGKISLRCYTLLPLTGTDLSILQCTAPSVVSSACWVGLLSGGPTSSCQPHLGLLALPPFLANCLTCQQGRDNPPSLGRDVPPC